MALGYPGFEAAVWPIRPIKLYFSIDILGNILPLQGSGFDNKNLEEKFLGENDHIYLKIN
jgi:hypothetical protein